MTDTLKDMRPIMAYSGESRAKPKHSNKKNVQKNKNTKHRNITAYLLMDRKRNEEIRATCEVQDAERWIRMKYITGQRLNKTGKTKKILTTF